MRQASAKFDAAVKESHRVAVTAEVLTAAGSEPIEVIDGSVTLSATAGSRGSLDLTVPVDLAPTDSSSLLAPYGNEIKVSRGIEYPDGSVELVSLGVYRIDSVTATDSSLSLTGIDRSIKVIDAVFEEPYSLTAGANIADVIQLLIAVADPTTTFRFATTALTTPALFADDGTDRWDFCQGLGEAMGCSLYYDGDGVCVLAPAPTGLTPPVYTVSEGEGGVLLGASRDWSRADAVNRVKVTGEAVGSSGDVPTGEARDTNPLSPTFYGGLFGKVTFTYSSSYVTTDEQADFVALVILTHKLGTTAAVSFDSLADPRLEPYDVVQVRREQIGADESHILDSVTIPLGLGQMSATTRALQVVA